MGYVSYVGRVGALAVALGVGSAVATMPGVALAQPSDTSSSDSPAKGSSGSSASPSPDKNSPSSSDSHLPSLTKVSSGSSGAGGSSADSLATADPRTGLVQSTGGAQTSTIAGSTGKKKVSPSELSPASDDAPMTSRAASLLASPSPQASQGSSASTLAAPSALQAANPTTSSDPVTSAVAGLSALTAAATQAISPQAVPAASTGGLDPLNTIAGLVSTLLGLVGSGLNIVGNPLAPIQNPILWAVLGFARREFDPTSTAHSPGSPGAAALLLESPNLLLNPDAEFGDPSLSGYASVTVPGWSVTGAPTVIKYDTPRRFPWAFGSPGPTFPSFLAFPKSKEAPPDGGKQFFGGGPVASSTLTQAVDLSAAAPEIDAGTVPYKLSGDLGGFTIDPSSTRVTVDFRDANLVQLGTGTLQPVSIFDRAARTEFLERDISGTIPVGTRSAYVVVDFTDRNPVLGNYNNAYADNLSLTVGANLPDPGPPKPPPSNVGQLDHLYMVYMENKGFGDIVNSPNAPYLNSLINTYGFGTNYYALTHPSDPNYYPIVGGSDFGFNWNCPSNCFDQPNLADNIEAAGKTWAGYMDGGGGYSAPTDRLPFLAFSDIYNNPARVESHLFDLSQMGPDLTSPSTAPNFAWFSADDATNMEGPLDLPFGLLQWAVSQLTTHQYNVKAGDEFLQQEVPVIMNSPVWQDPTQKSAIVITFDEDYNNISLGNGNQGNHIVTVVIPSPGAVTGGMRTGHFTADSYNNHYSLLRTIEDSLGLPPLTNNDKYAQPMNDYWW
jgi:hypothetical protein